RNPAGVGLVPPGDRAAPLAVPATHDLGPGLAKVLLYLLWLEPSGRADLPALLARIVERARQRLRRDAGLDPSAGLLEEAQRIVAAAADAPRGAGRMPPIPMAVPPVALQRMPEQRLQYWAPLRALRNLAAGLMPYPHSKKRFGQ